MRKISHSSARNTRWEMIHIGSLNFKEIIIIGGSLAAIAMFVLELIKFLV